MLLTKFLRVVIYSLIHEISESFAVFGRRNAGDILAQKCAFEDIFEIFSGFEDCEYIDDAKDVELAWIDSQNTALELLENIFGGISLYIFLRFP